MFDGTRQTLTVKRNRARHGNYSNVRHRLTEGESILGDYRLANNQSFSSPETFCLLRFYQNCSLSRQTQQYLCVQQAIYTEMGSGEKSDKRNEARDIAAFDSDWISGSDYRLPVHTATSEI